MTIIEINKRFYTIPTAWNELSGKQLIGIMLAFESVGTGSNKIKLKLLQILCNMSAWRFLWAPVEQLYEFFYLLDFLLENNTLTKNILPFYKGFYGPADNLDNLIVAEYIYSESYFIQYRESNALTDLNSLVAVLYRPPKSNYNLRLNPGGDTRQLFNANLVGHYAAAISRWPLSVKLAILHFYEGCRAQLATTYDDVFSGGEGEPAKRGLLSIAISMAESNTFGTFHDIERLELHTFMIGMSEALEKARQIEKQLKKTS